MSEAESAVLTSQRFRFLMQRYAVFHASFLMVFILELLSILFFIPLIAKTVGFAILVAATFLTVFTYFVLRFYLQTKKTGQLIALQSQFLKDCDREAEQQKAPVNAEIKRVQLMHSLLQELHGRKIQNLFPLFHAIFPFLSEKFSLWCHWEDTHWFKESLYLSAVGKVVGLIKLLPTDVELHKILASVYIELYQIYRMPKDAHPFMTRYYEISRMKEKFEKGANSAIEELKVVLTYVPHDGWALGQMAKMYRDLGLRQEEKKAYEAFLNFHPQDGEIQYQLGKLYFELGQKVQGLHLYEELQRREDPKAGDLIQHY